MAINFKIGFIHLTWVAEGNVPDATENHYIAEVKVREGFETEPEVRILCHVGVGPATRTFCCELAERASVEGWSRSRVLQACHAEIAKKHAGGRGVAPKRRTRVEEEDAFISQTPRTQHSDAGREESRVERKPELQDKGAAAASELNTALEQAEGDDE